ncbi:MAG: hypothetical protein EP343_04155 [Deltaproteobacteria bacterium]|nr:MAG: hypothetical protein EP343_04155 [Deltaproteobacteria bacterium]
MGLEIPPGTWIPLLNKNPNPPDPNFSITALGLRVLLLIDDKLTVAHLADLTEQPEEKLWHELRALEQNDYLTLSQPKPSPEKIQMEPPPTTPDTCSGSSLDSLNSLIAQAAASDEQVPVAAETATSSLLRYTASAKAGSARGTAQVAFTSVPVEQSEMTRAEAEKIQAKKSTTRELRNFSMSDYLSPESRDRMLTQAHTPVPATRSEAVESVELEQVQIPSQPSQLGLPQTPVPASNALTADEWDAPLEEYTMDDLEIVSFEESDEHPETETFSALDEDDLEDIELDSVILPAHDEHEAKTTPTASFTDEDHTAQEETQDLIFEDVEFEDIEEVDTLNLSVEEVEEVDLDAVILTPEEEEHAQATDSLLQELLGLSDPLDEP